MRKPLVFVFALALTAVMAYGAIGSAAWFTSSDTVAVTATSGKVHVTADPTDFTVSNLMPGVWTDAYMVQIHNEPDSTVPVKYRVMDEFVSQTVAGFYDQILVKVNQWYCGVNGPEITPATYQGLLENLVFTNANGPTLFTTGLPINTTACYNLYFKLLDATPNTFQSQTAHFNLDVDATQLENPGWAQ